MIKLNLIFMRYFINGPTIIPDLKIDSCDGCTDNHSIRSYLQSFFGISACADTAFAD